jgi:hypothetical protein
VFPGKGDGRVRSPPVNDRFSNFRDRHGMKLRSVARVAALGLLAAGLTGCAYMGFYREAREPWRAQASERCMAAGLVQPSAYVRPRRAIEGPGICGADTAFVVAAGARGEVAFTTEATLDCPMVAALDRWIDGAVQPAAYALYGQPVTEIKVIGSYACRGRNGASKGPLSEHAFANAVDIAGFTLADGRTVAVLDGWRGGTGEEQTFLRAVHRGGCAEFTTVIGPDGDRHHQDHIHLDLARHGRKGTGRRYCR